MPKSQIARQKAVLVLLKAIFARLDTWLNKTLV